MLSDRFCCSLNHAMPTPSFASTAPTDSPFVRLPTKRVCFECVSRTSHAGVWMYTLHTPTRIHTIAIAFCFRAHAPLSSPPPCFKHSTPYCPFPDDRAHTAARRDIISFPARSRTIRNLRLDTRDWNATRSHSVPTTGPRAWRKTLETRARLLCFNGYG